MTPINTNIDIPQPKILRWEAANIATEDLLISLRWGEVRIGLDIHYWINERLTAISVYQQHELCWMHQCFVVGSTLPYCEPHIDQLDYAFDAVAETIARHWPGKRLVRGAPIHIGTNMGGDADDDCIPVTYDFNPGDFEFSNTTV